MKRATSCGLALTIVFISARAADDAKPALKWSLIVEQGESRRAVRLDDGKVTDLKVGVGAVSDSASQGDDFRTVSNTGSPDGRSIVYEMASGAARLKHVIAVAGIDGKSFRMIVKMGHNTRPTWSPDSKRIAFVSQRDGVRHVYRIDADGQNEKQISREPVPPNCRPGFTADGRIVYAIDRGRDGKLPLADLVVGDGEKETVLVRRQYIIDSATTADGTHLAVIVTGELAIHELKTGDVQRATMTDVNPQWHVTFFSLLWRPDGKALATNFGFLGGRQAGTHLEGEDHLGILTLDTPKPTIKTYKVGDGYGLYAWVTDDQVQRQK
jgi:dipeptidyl aminopeptidase/acylaminoacyl peptidase